MKILILGKNGNLGSSLTNYLSKEHKIVALGRSEMDLSKDKLIREKNRASFDSNATVKN